MKKHSRSVLPAIAALSIRPQEVVSPVAAAYRHVRAEGMDLLGDQGAGASALRRSITAAISRETTDQVFVRREGDGVALTRAGAAMAVYQIGRPPAPLGSFEMPRGGILVDQLHQVAATCDAVRVVTVADLGLTVLDGIVGADRPPRTPEDLRRVEQATIDAVVRLRLGRGVAIRRVGRNHVAVGGVADPLAESSAKILTATAASPTGLTRREMRGILSSAGTPAGRLPDRILRALRETPGGPWVERSTTHALLWTLTDVGRDVIAFTREEIAPQAEEARNVTARWFDAHMAALYPILEKKIRARCQVSHYIGTTMDHVQEYLRRAIHRDAFRSRLEAGQSIPLSQVAVFALRSAQNDIRNSGSEPVCRELYGARTEREVKHGDGPERDRSTWRKSARMRSVRAEEGSVVDMADAVDGVSSAPSLDETVAFQQVWSRLEVHIRKTFQAGEIDLILAFLRARMQGASIAETASVLHIEPGRAQVIHRRIRSELGDVVRSLTA